MAEEALYEDLSDMNSQWEEICSQLKVEFGETAVNSWLKPLRINSFDNGVVNISAPTILCEIG